MSRLPYVICDVFTDRPLAGNQLAVFPQPGSIETATMQALAKEVNFAETTFLLPAREGGDARVRIFTPLHELRFAGHPTLGTAFVLATSLGRPSIRLETGSGIVPVRFDPRTPSFGWMDQPLPTVEPYVATARLLRALGVAASGLPVEVYDNGLRHVYVEVESPEAVAALKPDFARLAEFTDDLGINTFAGRGSRWKTRMFAPGHGVVEDAATGSAAGPLALHLARHGRIRFGDEIAIEQGVEIGRPSRLHARVTGGTERVTRVEVGGNVIEVARGEFVLP